MFNLPNILTLIRIILIPVFVIVFYRDTYAANVFAALIFTLACITDWLDGYLARRWHQVSPFGRFLDPVADKLIVAVALILLLQDNPVTIMALPVMVIIAREITVSALREWMAEIGSRAKVAVSSIGKFKTAAQMLAILLLLLRKTLFGDFGYYVGFALLYVAVALTIWSMVVYIIAAWPALFGKETQTGKKVQI